MEFLSGVEVQLVDHMGSDLRICQAARISTGAGLETGWDEKRDRGLLNYLMEHRHGTPFEHGALTLYVHAPIFVFREWHRHRVQSYNEMSGRYMELLPEFWIPGPERPLKNIGTSARPSMVPMPGVYEEMVEVMGSAYAASWRAYQTQLELGVAKEVARTVLPVGTYSKMYATMNPRSCMHFLSLRTKSDEARYPSNPQHEIDLAARAVEDIFSRIWPVTYEMFVKHGRVAP